MRAVPCGSRGVQCNVATGGELLARSSNVGVFLGSTGSPQAESRGSSVGDTRLRGLAGRIKIRVLAHLALHFLALFFVIEENFAVAEVAAFDFSLRAIEE